jgi:hypothetical protein
MLRVRFQATVTAKSQKGEFPCDTVSAVYLTNRDDCSYSYVRVNKNGEMNVEYDMKSLKSDVKLTSRMKLFFFFTDVTTKLEMPICAGHITLEELVTRVKKGGPDFTCGSNFTSNEVKLSFKANPASEMYLDHQQLLNNQMIVPSALDKTKDFLAMFHSLDESVRLGLQKNLEITQENGGPMFSSLFTGHVMEGEATLYNLYHIDFDGAKNVPAWLCMYLLAETLLHNAFTCEDVKTLRVDELTRFIASYAQALMRSASAAPYTSDYTMNEDPGCMHTGRCTKLSEVFKRPFSHPYPLMLKGRNGVIYDDCEGLAACMRDITNCTMCLHDRFGEDLKRPEVSMEYSSMMNTCCPPELFSEMSLVDCHKLLDLALFVGNHLKSGVIECKITLVSANAASMSGPPGTKEIQAHACASLVCHDKNYPIAVMLEGTACMVDEIHTKKVQVGTQFFPLTEVANSLSMDPRFNTFSNASETEIKVAMHVAHTKGSFYRTAFCQSDTLLASQIGQAPISYGVDMEYLADRSILVHMPVMGTALGQGGLETIKDYVVLRSAEIHPPLVDHSVILERLKWAPIQLFKGCKELQGKRPYLSCMLHVTANDGNVKPLLQRCQGEVAKFNADPKHAEIGVMRTFASMDGVSKLFHIYSDNTTSLEKCLQPITH